VPRPRLLVNKKVRCGNDNAEQDVEEGRYVKIGRLITFERVMQSGKRVPRLLSCRFVMVSASLRRARCATAAQHEVAVVLHR
jgi:hypothetical protein